MGTIDRARLRALLIGIGLGLPVSGFFLWLAARSADFESVFTTAGAARPLPIGGALVCMFVVYWLQAARWRTFVPAPVSQRQVLSLVVASVAVNNVLPGRIGDVLRARWISQAAGIPGGRGLASVVLDRGSDLVVLTGCLLVTLPLVTDEPWIDRIVGVSCAVALLFLASVGAAHTYARRRARGRRDRRLVRRVARDTLEGLAEQRDAKKVLRASAYAVGAWLAWACAAYLSAQAVGIQLTPLEALFVTAVLNLGAAIPSSPGFVGTYQWLAVSALALFSVGADSALAFSIVIQAVWYVPTTVAGAVLLGRRAWRRRVPSSAYAPRTTSAMSSPR